MKLKVLENIDVISAELAKLVLGRIEQAAQNNRQYYIALSGGRSPKKFYQLLNEQLEQSKLDLNNLLGVVQIDERWVSKTNARSNQFMISESLKAITTLDNFHPIPTPDMYPEVGDAVADYETTLKTVVSYNDYINLGIFGMGTDGHTASLFPDDPMLDDMRNKFVVAGYVESQREYRISLTPDVFQHIRQKVFLITGAEKGRILKSALETKKSKVFPILLALDNQSLVFLDQDAFNGYKGEA